MMSDVIMIIHVLLAIGRPHEIAHGSLRISLCKDNTEEEVEYMLKEIPKVVNAITKTKNFIMGE